MHGIWNCRTSRHIPFQCCLSGPHGIFLSRSRDGLPVIPDAQVLCMMMSSRPFSGWPSSKLTPLSHFLPQLSPTFPSYGKRTFIPNPGAFSLIDHKAELPSVLPVTWGSKLYVKIKIIKKNCKKNKREQIKTTHFLVAAHLSLEFPTKLQVQLLQVRDGSLLLTCVSPVPSTRAWLRVGTHQMFVECEWITK